MKKFKILIVEDDPIESLKLKGVLIKNGFSSISQAFAKDEAKKMIESFPPDLILMDVKLSETRDDMGGIELAQEVNQNSKIPFIFTSALDKNREATRAQQLKPLAFFVKPYKYSELVAQINQFFSKSV